MRQAISIQMFRRAIQALPSDEPRSEPGVWYLTQKEHWLGWLGGYHGPGAYGRLTGKCRDARFAYNHIVEPLMLLWLVEAAGLSRPVTRAARNAAARGRTLMHRSAAIRKLAPWDLVRAALWPST